MRRYPILPDHPGESLAYRKRFRSAISLCLGYRVIGTVAALVAFRSQASVLSRHPEVVYGLLGGYLVGATWMLYQVGSIRLPFGAPRVIGREELAWQDLPAFLWTDLAVAVVLNLVLAAQMHPDRVFTQFADIASIPMITSVALWTGRRGGLIGMRVVLLGVGTEVLKAPLNGIGLSTVPWGVVASRGLWLVCGWLVAVGITRILLDYAERVDKLHMEEDLLSRLSRSHDDYKDALQRIIDLLSADPDAGHTALDLAASGLAADHRSLTAVPDSVHTIVQQVVERARTVQPAMEFIINPGFYQTIVVPEAEGVRVCLDNLVMNAAKNSRGTRTTVHWRIIDEALVISVFDDGQGMSRKQTGHGLALARRSIESAGGAMAMDDRVRGTRWIVQIPAGCFTVDP